jgi:hypothetical protein
MPTKLVCDNYDIYARFYFRTLRDELEVEGTVIGGEYAEFIYPKDSITGLSYKGEIKKFKGGLLHKTFSAINKYNNRPALLSSIAKITENKVVYSFFGHVKKVYTLNEHGLPVFIETTYKHVPTDNSKETISYKLEDGFPTETNVLIERKKKEPESYRITTKKVIEDGEVAYIEHNSITDKETRIISYKHI